MGTRICEALAISETSSEGEDDNNNDSDAGSSHEAQAVSQIRQGAAAVQGKDNQSRRRRRSKVDTDEHFSSYSSHTSSYDVDGRDLIEYNQAAQQAQRRKKSLGTGKAKKGSKGDRRSGRRTKSRRLAVSDEEFSDEGIYQATTPVATDQSRHDTESASLSQSSDAPLDQNSTALSESEGSLHESDAEAGLGRWTVEDQRHWQDPCRMNEEDVDYEISCIIRWRRHPRKNYIQYRIKWQGYSDHFNTWAPASNFNERTTLKDFWKSIKLNSEGTRPKDWNSACEDDESLDTDSEAWCDDPARRKAARERQRLELRRDRGAMRAVQARTLALEQHKGKLRDRKRERRRQKEQEQVKEGSSLGKLALTDSSSLKASNRTLDPVEVNGRALFANEGSRLPKSSSPEILAVKESATMKRLSLEEEKEARQKLAREKAREYLPESDAKLKHERRLAKLVQDKAGTAAKDKSSPSQLEDVTVTAQAMVLKSTASLNGQTGRRPATFRGAHHAPGKIKVITFASVLDRFPSSTRKAGPVTNDATASDDAPPDAENNGIEQLSSSMQATPTHDRIDNTSSAASNCAIMTRSSLSRAVPVVQSSPSAGWGDDDAMLPFSPMIVESPDAHQAPGSRLTEANANPEDAERSAKRARFDLPTSPIKSWVPKEGAPLSNRHAPRGQSFPSPQSVPRPEHAMALPDVHMWANSAEASSVTHHRKPLQQPLTGFLGSSSNCSIPEARAKTSSLAQARDQISSQQSLSANMDVMSPMRPSSPGNNGPPPLSQMSASPSHGSSILSGAPESVAPDQWKISEELQGRICASYHVICQNTNADAPKATADALAKYILEKQGGLKNEITDNMRLDHTRSIIWILRAGARWGEVEREAAARHNFTFYSIERPTESVHELWPFHLGAVKMYTLGALVRLLAKATAHVLGASPEEGQISEPVPETPFRRSKGTQVLVHPWQVHVIKEWCRDQRLRHYLEKVLHLTGEQVCSAEASIVMHGSDLLDEAEVLDNELTFSAQTTLFELDFAEEGIAVERLLEIAAKVDKEIQHTLGSLQVKWRRKKRSFVLVLDSSTSLDKGRIGTCLEEM